MKRAAVIVGTLSFAVWAAALTSGPGGQQGQPATGQTPAATTPAASPAPAQPASKRPPQAKTQPEFDAWKAASANTDPAGLEKAADDFATKFPDSELRLLLYKNAMRLYQKTNNAEKTEATGRKVLALDGDDPEALTQVAEVIAEKTRESDIDKDQRFDDGMKMAQKALQTVDTDVSVPPGTPQDKLDAYKAGLRSQAYSTMGAIEYNKGNFPAAQTNFEKAIDAYPSDPYALDVLRLALSLDKQQKYPEALKVANRAVDMTKESDQLGATARRERDRLQQLTGTTPAPSQPPKN
ncbi:MAG: tetratricopeptide repeat protein [Terriglobales bacterium]